MTATATLRAALADRYRIERELGAGGMATVYLAHDLRHDRDVAIKVLHPDLGAALGGERFLAEIRTTARLQHPHILPLLDSGAVPEGLLYYVMPLVDGETLRARLERERQLPLGDALRIAREVADALGYAHGHGVIHRDIKPENILLQGGHALVADFGIALAVQQAGGQRMTQTGLSLGTPQYMSPEQAMGERAIDARSDIYALGAVTYEMLAGDPPFTGSSVQAIVAKILSERPTPLRTVRDTVPAGVEQAVLTALAKLPADRFATAADFTAALNQPEGSVARLAPTAVATPPTRGARAAIAIVLVAAGGAAGWWAARSSGGAASGDAVTITSIVAPNGGSFRERRSLALSPDGRRLAFVFSAADGSRTIWLRSLDRLDAEAVPGTEGADAPFWSPDGRSLGFFSAGYLMVRDESGEPRRLCPVSSPTGGSWSTSGTILFGDRTGLATVLAAGGACKTIVARANGPSLRGLFLPDGERFLYSRGPGADMIVASLDGKTLATLPVRAAEFAFVPPSHLIVPDPADIRAINAWALDPRTLALSGPPRRIVSNVRAASNLHTFSFSATGALAFLPAVVDRPYLELGPSGQVRDSVRMDGAWTLSTRPLRAGPALVAIAGNTVGVWLYELDSDRRTRLLAADSTAPTGERAGQIWPVFEATGARLLYAATSTSGCEVHEHDLTTQADRLVLREAVGSERASCPSPLDWSDDGRRVLLRRDTSLRVLALDGAAPPIDIARPGQVWEGRFAPGGRTVAYSDDETGRAEVYVQALPAGQPVRVSSEGGRWPVWTLGGRRLTWVTPDGRVQTTEIASGPVGVPRTLFAITGWRRSTFDDRGAGFGIVGDGERYIVRQSPSSAAIAYVEHWPALLRASVR